MGPWLTLLSFAVACLGWCAGIAVLGRRRPAFPDGETERKPGPTISVIIPARNEAERLPTLLQSIQAQETPPFEVIVVDDESTDATAAEARQLGARVIPAGDLPDGWRGKTWACQVGADAASGEVFLFLDADTWFEPGGLARIVGTYCNGVLSAAPYHAVVRPHEELSAFFNLVMTAGVGAFTLLERPPDGLFGQMLMIDRETYKCVGGHAAVRGEVLENLHLAARLRELGVPMRCCLGRGVLSIRMYPDDVSSVVRGWGKAFAGGARRVSPIVLFGISLWLCGAVSAISVLILNPSVFSVAAYAAFAGQIYCLLRPLGSFKAYTALLFPIPLLFFFAVFAQSAAGAGRGIEWKGRIVRTV